MKLGKPEFGLEFLTIIWGIYAVLNIYWLEFPSQALSLFGLLLISGIVSAIGIWLDIKLFGYVFSVVNLIGAVLLFMIALGYFEPERPFSLQTLLAIGVTLYCTFASVRWTRIRSRDSQQQFEISE